MKFVCTQENLQHGLYITSRVSDRNTNLPILNNVLIQAQKQGITLTATNLEIGIKTTIRGKVETDGEITVPSKLAFEFVNSLGKENITVSLEGTDVKIEGTNHQTTIRGTEAIDFPALPGVEKKTNLALPTDKLANALNQVLFAVSSDETRPELTGVFVNIAGKSLTLAATDSYRLSEKTIPLASEAEENRSVIIPSKTLNEVARILENEDAESLEISINDNQILFTIGDTEVISRLITGNYPDYKQIVPTAFSGTIEFKKEDLVGAIKTTALFCKQGINDVRLELDKRFTDISITAENSTFGKNTSHVPTASKGQEANIVFNYKFLLDGLLHFKNDALQLKVNDAVSPAVLMDEKDEGFVYIIMPIKQ